MPLPPDATSAWASSSTPPTPACKQTSTATATACSSPSTAIPPTPPTSFKVIGGISLILAFFAFQSLPINYAGLLLILFGIVLLVAEIKIVSHGVLALGGI